MSLPVQALESCLDHHRPHPFPPFPTKGSGYATTLMLTVKIQLRCLCKDLEDVAASASTGIMFGPPPPPSISSISDERLRLCNDAHVDGENPTSLQSQLFDNDGRLSVSLMIRQRQAFQPQTSIHSERTFE